jgi:hypothetical protein
MNDINEERRPVDTDALFWGLLLVGMGTLFLLDRLHIGDMHYLLRNFWPLFIVAIGLSKIFKRGRVWSGLWLIAVGGWLEAVTLHLYDLTYESSWPLLLIIIGAGMVLRAVFEGTRKHRGEASDSTAEEARHDG